MMSLGLLGEELVGRSHDNECAPSFLFTLVGRMESFVSGFCALFCSREAYLLVHIVG